MAATTVSPASDRLLELVGLLEAQDGFAEVVAALKAAHAATLDGVWGSACALVAASLTQHVPGGARSRLLPARRGRGAPSATGPLQARLPPSDFRCANRSRPSGCSTTKGMGQRLRVLKALQGPEPPRLIVTCTAALLQPVASRALGQADADRCGCGEQDRAGRIWPSGSSRPAIRIPRRSSCRANLPRGAFWTFSRPIGRSGPHRAFWRRDRLAVLASRFPASGAWPPWNRSTSRPFGRG